MGGGLGSGAVSVRFERPLWNRTEASPRFHDATTEAGLGAPRNDPPYKVTNWLIADIWPGSGVAVLDYNRDGFEDLFVGDGVRSILYENDGRGRFTDVTAKAGLAKTAAEGVAATGVASGDVDGDGFPDLFVTDAFGPARLFRNSGDGTFEETTDRSGIALSKNMRSAAFADVDGDGDLDLFVCVAGDYYGQMPDPPFDANDAKPNHLYVNDGNGHFTDATEAWGLGKVSRWSLSSLFADYDGDGRVDLLVTNDFGLKNLYRNVDGRRFEDVSKKSGMEVRAYGMSGAWGDFDGDGLLDAYTTGTDTQWYFLHEYPSMPVGLPGRIFLPIAIRWMEKMSTGNSLLLQRADHTFADATARSGRGVRRLELERRRGGPRQRLAAGPLHDQRHVGRRPGPRPRARVLVGLPRLLGRLRRRKARVRPQGRRDRRHRARPVLSQPGRRARPPSSRTAPFSTASTSSRTAARPWPSTPTATARSTCTCAPCRRPRRSSSGAAGPESTSSGCASPATTGTRQPRRRRRAHRGDASGRAPRADRDGQSERLPFDRRARSRIWGSDGATRLSGLSVRWPSGRVQELGPVEAVDRTIVVDEDRGIVPDDPPGRP